jgi:ABC-2 type transport system permease protein
MPDLRLALLIAAKDLRQRSRDGTLLIVGVVAPLGLATIFSLLLSGVTAFRADYAIVDLDRGDLARVFREDVVGTLVAADVATVEVFPDAASARAAVEAGDVESAFVIPAGFSAAILDGLPARIEIYGARSAPFATSIAQSLVASFGDRVAAVQLAVWTADELTAGALEPAQVAQVTAVAAALPSPIDVVDIDASLRQLDASTFFSAAMAVLFIFFAAQAGVASVIGERRGGTLGRILAGPVAPSTILLGKGLGGFMTSLLAMTILVVATTVGLGADWGPPLGVSLVVGAVIVTAVGLTTLITSFARTEDAAGGANSAVAITLGILGGTFSPATQAPEVMAQLSLITPHAWFLRGLGDLHGAGAVWTDALPSVAVLLTMGLVTGAIGFARARRLVTAR